MQLTRQGDYAVRVALDLTSHTGVQPIREVAARQGIPLPFLQKIARQLAAAGILETVRGARGGLRLLRPAAAITLRQVVEAIEGPLALNQCLLEGRSCERVEFCPAHPVWVRAQRAFLRELEALNLGEILSRQREGGEGEPTARGPTGQG